MLSACDLLVHQGSKTLQEANLFAWSGAGKGSTTQLESWPEGMRKDEKIMLVVQSMRVRERREREREKKKTRQTDRQEEKQKKDIITEMRKEEQQRDLEREVCKHRKTSSCHCSGKQVSRDEV